MLLINDRMRLYTFREPYIPSYYTIMPDDCLSAKDGTAGINDDIVLNGGMPFLFGQAFLNEQGSQGYSLVDLYIISDHCGFTNDGSGTMVDKERIPLWLPPDGYPHRFYYGHILR